MSPCVADGERAVSPDDVVEIPSYRISLLMRHLRVYLPHVHRPLPREVAHEYAAADGRGGSGGCAAETGPHLCPPPELVKLGSGCLESDCRKRKDLQLNAVMEAETVLREMGRGLGAVEIEGFSRTKTPPCTRADHVIAFWAWASLPMPRPETKDAKIFQWQLLNSPRVHAVSIL